MGTITTSRLATAAVVGSILLCAGAERVVADEARRPERPVAERGPAQAADEAAYREECGACHVAYPRSLLRAADWSLVLARLGQHYGVDATLDATAAAAVARHLGASGPPPAQPARDASAALPRITTQSWFLREHREPEARRRLGNDAKWSQCDTCHAGAAAGRFEEDRS